MSTPGQSRAQGQSPQAQTPATGQSQQPAGQGQQQGKNQPAQQQGKDQPAQQTKAAARPSRSRSTPRLLRWARAGAAAAALLTGVAATGTFSADGVNATPNVIAQQWVSAERAGVEMAQAALRAAERVVGEDDEATRSGFDAAVSQVGADLTRVEGTGGDTAAGIAQDWSTFVVGAERAAASAADEGAQAAAPVYGAASEAARSATSATDGLAEQHAQDLRTGSRSTLTAVVGTLATAALVALMFWLALRTRRIVNPPLLVATAITAGLAYVSLNPSALPITYDQRIASTTETATALQDVYQARQAQQARVLGLEDRWETEAAEAQQAVYDLGVPPLRDAWNEVVSGHEAAATDGTTDPAEAVTGTQGAFDTLEQGLRDRLEDQLGESASAVGRPAVLTSGVGLLLGLVGAALAWTGISQRLREYR